VKYSNQDYFLCDAVQGMSHSILFHNCQFIHEAKIEIFCTTNEQKQLNEKLIIKNSRKALNTKSLSVQFSSLIAVQREIS